MKKKILAILLTLAIVLPLFALPSSARTTLKLSVSSLTLGVNERFTPKATTNATTAVTWRSTDAKIATVSRTGEIRARAVGTATVRATVGGVSQEIKVTVRKAPNSVRAGNISVAVGETERIRVRLPSGTASRARTFESADRRIARVSANGTITGIRPGKTTITVTTFNNRKTTLTVTVSAARSVVGEWHYTGISGENGYYIFNQDGTGSCVLPYSSVEHNVTCNQDGTESNAILYSRVGYKFTWVQNGNTVTLTKYERNNYFEWTDDEWLTCPINPPQIKIITLNKAGTELADGHVVFIRQ